MTARLDAEQIRQPIKAASQSRLELLEIFDEIDSTNSYLLDKPPPAAGHYRVALAEYQTRGRGCMDRRWISPASTGICLSLAYTFDTPPANPSGVTLAIGVAIARALRELGVDGVKLKWPNDLVLNDGKLGGILTETHQVTSDRLSLVIGVGINVDLGSVPLLVEPSTGTVSDLADFAVPSRNVIAAKLIESMFEALTTYESGGLQPFTSEWRELDWLHGRPVTVTTPQQEIEGVAAGIGAHGELLVDSDTGAQAVISGTVRVAGLGAND